MSATCEGISTKARGRCQILELELQAVVSHGHGCWLQAAGGHGHGCWLQAAGGHGHGCWSMNSGGHGHGCWLQAAGGHGHGCWSMNSGVLEEHLVLLTTEPPLQLLTFL